MLSMRLKMTDYVPTIGIETHVQLKTKTKLFSSESNDAREQEPNTTVSPICFGLPGVLPVLNEKAIDLAIRAGLALNGKIAERTKFDRKHYFYPDLPKGYQITQYDEPIIGSGHVDVPLAGGKTFKVRIERAHLEEDAGKSIHPPGADYSLVDLNRAGTPLLEIVSMPDMHSAEEAKAYVRELYLLMKYADVSDVDLYQGNMRFDVNVSMAAVGSKRLGTRSEMKNLNSFRSVERAVAYEIKRQTELLDKGKPVVQETRGWDEAKQKTIPQRTKEEAHDYRYFPEPDLPPVLITQKQLANSTKEMPKLPAQLRAELSTIGLDKAHVETLLEYPELITKVHQVNDLAGKKPALLAANLLANVWLSEGQASQLHTNAKQIVDLYELVDEGQLSSTAAKSLFLSLSKANPNADARELAKEMNLIQVSDTRQLEKLVEHVIEENPQAAKDIKSGEDRAIGFLVGQVMKESKGQANPQMVSELIKKKLN